MKLQFPSVFLGSLTSPAYYRDILRPKKTGHAVKYLGFLLVLLGIVWAAHWAIMASGLSLGAPFIENQKQVIRDLYPPELAVTVKDGIVSTNVNEPYAIPLPAQWRRLMSESEDSIPPYENLVVIDTAATPDAYPDSRSLVLVTRDALTFPSSEGGDIVGYETRKIDPSMNFFLDKTTYGEFMREALPTVDRIIGYVKALFVVWITLSPFIMAAVMLAGYALFLLFGALVVWIIDMAFLRKNLQYGEIYRLSLYGVTTPIILSYLLRGAHLQIPLVFTVAYVAWMTYVLSYFPAKPRAS